MKTKMIFLVALTIAITASALKTLPFSSYDYVVHDRSPDIFVGRCIKNEPPPFPNRQTLTSDVNTFTVEIVTTLKGTNSGTVALNSEHWLNRGDNYLILGRCENSVCEAIENYRVIPLGRETWVGTITNSIVGKSLDEQIHILFQQSVNHLNQQIQKEEEEKQRLETLNETTKSNIVNPLSQSRSDIDKATARHFEEVQKQFPVQAWVSVDKADPGFTCEVGVIGHTNVVAFKPLPEQAFDARLFDSGGREISKAKSAHGFGQPLRVDQKLIDGSYKRELPEIYGHSRRLDFTRGAGENHYWDFNVANSFQVTNAGEYHLRIQVRLFVQDTNAAFQPFILSPAETTVNISQGDLKPVRVVRP